MHHSKLACFLLLIGLIPNVLADTLTVTREGSGTSSESAATVRFWSGEDRLARSDDHGRMVVDVSARTLYIVNDQAGTCHAMATQDEARDPAAMEAAVDAVDFQKTGKSEQIGDWQADIYQLTSGTGDNALEIKAWISEEIGVDSGQRAYAESVATPDTAWMLAMYDLGFPVRAEIQMGPVTMWSELESIEEKPAPAGTYAIPEGCD